MAIFINSTNKYIITKGNMTDIERIDQQIARSYFDDEFELMHTKAMLFDFAKWKNEEVKKFLVSLCEIGSHMDMCNAIEAKIKEIETEPKE